jgi:ribonuclease BN (tRNA processing enzyme)
MKLVFLGTNGWYDSSTGNTICILFETPDAIILLDAGSGLYKADRFFSIDKPVHLFLSHLHLDHVIGLHLLNKFSIPKGLTIYLRKGDDAYLRSLIGPPYSLPFSALSYPVEIVEIDGEEIDADGVSVQSAMMLHSVPTIGFRLSAGSKTIAYCPDTGYCEGAVELARGADLLIAECAFRSGEESERWPHLNPESAATLARQAGVDSLALIHFDALRYPDPQSRREAAQKARAIFPGTVAVTDDQSIEL